MASIQKKNNKYCVVYYCKDTEGKRKQKWETYDTKNEAKIRKAEICFADQAAWIAASCYIGPTCIWCIRRSIKLLEGKQA